MRKKLIALLSLVMTLALALALSVSSVFATTPEPVDYAKDAKKWMWPYQIAVTEDGLKTTNAQYAAASHPIFASAKIKVVDVANIPDGQWGRHAIMFKVNDPNVFLWNPTVTASSGDWLAVAVTHENTAIVIYECVNGVVSAVASTPLQDGNDNWFLFKQTNTWEIEYKDVADGVEVVASFTPTDGIGHTPSGKTFTVKYKSTNTKLHGKGSMCVNRQGGGTVDADHYSLINVFVEEIVPEPEPEPPVGAGNDYAKDASKWISSTVSGFTFDSQKGMVGSGAQYTATTNKIGGNSTVTIVEDGYITADQWFYDAIIIKAKEPVDYLTTNELSTSSTGNWLAIVRTNGAGAAIYECVDGVVSNVKNLWTSAYNGYDFWYTVNQKNTLTITTTDNDEGVLVTVSYDVTDYRNSVAESEQGVGNLTATYQSTNKKLWGEGHVIMDRFGGGTGYDVANGKTIYYNVFVDELASEYSYEDYIANNPAGAVIGLIDALPTEINRINYSASVKAGIESAQDAYDALTDEQKAEVANKAKLDAALAALSAYEATLAEPDFDATNLAQDSSKWSRYGNVNASDVEISNYGLAFKGSYGSNRAMLLKDNVKEDSTITVRFDAQTKTSWGQAYVMFKGMDGAETISAGLPITATDHGGVTGAPQGTWMALMFGNSSQMYFAYCVDGEYVQVPVSTVPGSEFNNSHTQITDITIVTEDTETGVDVTITYKASGIAGITGETYTLGYTVENTVFHGAGAVAVGVYNGSIEPSEKITVTDFRVSHASGEALVKRASGNELNFATDRKYWKDGANMAGFEFSEDGAALWDVKTGGLLLNHKVQNEDVVKVALDSTLTRGAGTYGNVYFIIRSKEAKLLYNGSHFPAATGNYIVLQVGADGIKIFECVDGEMQHDAKLESTGAVSGGYDLSAGTNGNDIWYIYDNYTMFEFYTEDSDDGVNVYITMRAPSGTVYNFQYFSENVALHGEHYFGLEYFLHTEGSSNGLMNLESITISGVTEGFVPNVNVAEINAEMVALASTAITAENVDEIRDAYNAYAEIYETLNYDMRSEFNVNALDIILANIQAYDAEVFAAETLVEIIELLPTEVTAENFEDTRETYLSVKAAYDMLSAGGKALVTNKAKLEALGAKIEAYEIDVDAATAFDALVTAIPELTDANRAEVTTAVESAESAYAALTDAQKQLATKHDALVALRAALDASAPSESYSGCMAGFVSAPFLALAALVAIRRLKRKA